MIPNSSMVYYKGRAALSSNDKDRIELVFADKSTARVREKDVELLFNGPLKSLPTAAAAPAAAELETAWEMTAGSSVSLAELCELLYGAVSPAEILATRQLVDDSLLFVYSDQGVQVRDAGQRSELEGRQDRKNREQAERTDFIARGKQGKATAADQRYWGEVEAYALGRTAKSAMAKELGLADSPEASQRWLLKCGLWSNRTNPHPARAGHPAKAPELPLQLELIDSLPRTDLRELPAWAIDNAWSHDPDDAVSWDGEYVWVHIADPAAAIPPDSPADREAANRAATLYLPEGSIPMLPDAALEQFGLGLSAESPALSFRIKLDEDGLPDDILIQPSLVRVQRLSYEKADALLETGPLAELNRIAWQREARRKANGAVDIDIPELRVWLDQSEIRLQQIAKFRSSALVREMMILTSEAAARWAFQRSLPFPYYSQEAPGSQDSLPEGLAGEFAKRRLMKAGKGGVQPHAHQGLGVSMYAQASSPLRRYSDLLAHQQIRAALARELDPSAPAPLPADELSLRLGTAAAQAAALRKAERASCLHYTIAWLLEHPDWQGLGTVVHSAADTTLYIEELGLETRIKGGGYELNSRLQLRFLKAELAELEVYFAPQEQQA